MTSHIFKNNRKYSKYLELLFFMCFNKSIRYFQKLNYFKIHFLNKMLLVQIHILKQIIFSQFKKAFK